MTNPTQHAVLVRWAITNHLQQFSGCLAGWLVVLPVDLSVVPSMVAVAQLVESRIVIPVVVGSSPISHPNNIKACGDAGLFHA